MRHIKFLFMACVFIVIGTRLVSAMEYFELPDHNRLSWTMETNICPDLASRIILFRISGNLDSKILPGEAFEKITRGEFLTVKRNLARELGLHPTCFYRDSPYELKILHLAAGKGFIDVVKFLIAMGFDFNKQDIEYGTPLCLASAEGQLQVVRVLCGYGANIEEKTFFTDETPLDLARQRDHFDIVDFLQRLQMQRA
jgi:ankyrin repeat protein